MLAICSHQFKCLSLVTQGLKPLLSKHGIHLLIRCLPTALNARREVLLIHMLQQTGHEKAAAGLICIHLDIHKLPREEPNVLLSIHDKHRRIRYPSTTITLSMRCALHCRFGDWNIKETDYLNSMQLISAKPAVYLVNLTEKAFFKKKSKWLPKVLFRMSLFLFIWTHSCFSTCVYIIIVTPLQI